MTRMQQIEPMISLPRAVLFELVNLYHEGSMEYSLLAARVSLFLDLESSRTIYPADYIRIWRWSRKKFRHHWPAIVEDVERWKMAVQDASNNPGGAKTKGQLGAGQGPDRGRKCQESTLESQGRGQVGATKGPDKGQLTTVLRRRRTNSSSSSLRQGPKIGRDQNPDGGANNRLVGSEDRRLAHLLARLITANYPTFRVPDLEAWAGEIRAIASNEQQSHAEIEAVIRWSQASEFWRSVIVSASKLREKYLQLKLQSEQKSSGHRQGHGPPAAIDYSDSF